VNYYERHIGDYIKKTAHLSLLEHGVYTRLLDVYYDRETGIPDDKAARLVGARNEPETQALQVVLQEFFELRDGVWFNSRCDQEIEAYAEGEPEREVKKANEGNRLKRHRQERAALFKVLTDRGEHAPWNIGMEELRQRVSALQVSGPETQPEMPPAMAPATPATATQTPLPIHQTPEKKKTLPPPAGGCARFEDFWSAWPKNERKQDKVKCARRWKDAGLDAEAERILADIAVKRQTQKWQEGYIEAPLVYLNGKRWEDGVTPQAGEQGGGSMFAGAI
jgi:uncharacterized protein YdaU (DUF1376 family)